MNLKQCWDILSLFINFYRFFSDYSRPCQVLFNTVNSKFDTKSWKRDEKGPRVHNICGPLVLPYDPLFISQLCNQLILFYGGLHTILLVFHTLLLDFFSLSLIFLLTFFIQFYLYQMIKSIVFLTI